MAKLNIPTLKFKTEKTPIDYFKIEEDYFKEGGFDFTKTNIQFSEQKKYLSLSSHFNELDLDEKNTVVFNFQVGLGKTTVFGELVKEYALKGYYVLICSPYIKLLNKELISVLGMFPKAKNEGWVSRFAGTEGQEYSTGINEVFFTEDYSTVDEANGDLFVNTAPFTKSIHLMTINCLLGNPGDEHLNQSWYKRRYLDNLLEATKGGKVVIFFDEIHESIHNFKSELIPNLLRWQGRVDKVFIASATFTAPSIPIIKSFSFLTDKKISIYESERVKTKVQADLSVHILSHIYNSKSKSFLSYLSGIIKNFTDKKRVTNIITPTKSLAQAIADISFPKNIIDDINNLRDDKSLDYIHLCTNDTELPFQEGQNNIGTTFKTGVNIEDSNSVLCIIFPTIRAESYFKHYGIFSDGIQSVIQSIGRLRNGGEIHLIMYDPQILIEHKANYPPLLLGHKKTYSFLNQNESFNIVQEEYGKRFEKLSDGINRMEVGLKKDSIIPLNNKHNFGFWYLNFHEYLIENHQAILLNHENPSFGKALSPYILWAALNNQFANCTLKQIYFPGSYSLITLTMKNAKKDFKDILNSHQSEFSKITFREAVNRIEEFLSEKYIDNQYIPIRYKVEPSILTAALLINRQPGYVKDALSELFKIKHGTELTFEKVEYLNKCLDEVSSIAQKATNLQLLYQGLLELKSEFNTWLITNLKKEKKLTLIPTNLSESLSDTFLKKAVKVISDIKKEDFIFSSKAISLLQNMEINKADYLKKSIFKLFLDLSYNSRSPKQIDGKKYIVVKELSQPPKKVGNTSII